MRYRRANVRGATYFITANLADRRLATLIERIDLLRESVRRVKVLRPFHIDAMIVLPDHFHLLMTLPEDDADISLRIGAIKAGFSKRLPPVEHVSSSRAAKRERGIWQRRFWEHLIRDDRDFEAHVNYIHINPVKHGYVKRASDWPHSSIHRFIANGIVGSDWATEIGIGEFGET